MSDKPTWGFKVERFGHIDFLDDPEIVEWHEQQDESTVTIAWWEPHA